MNRSLLKYSILILSLIIFGDGFCLYANDDKPEHPSNLQVIPNVGGFAKIRWKVQQNGAEIKGFKIYYAKGNTDNLLKFELLDSISRTDTNLHKDDDNFHWIFEHVGKGVFSFYITAFNQNGESEPSDIVNQTIGEPVVDIKFHSTPDTDGTVGENYTYTAIANASNLGLIKYDLEKSPVGMTINESSGEINWIPHEKGKYSVIVKAYLVVNEEICNYQPFTINVKSCNKTSTISGTISYTEGGLVESGFVKLYKKVEQQPNDPVLITNLTISNGFFTVNVDEGYYLLKFESDKFIPEWYENAGTLNEANLIRVKCGDNIQIVADVNKVVQIKKYIVTGRVTRESDGAPVPSSVVHFDGKNIQSGETKGKPAVTGPQGYYEIELESNYRYTAYIPGFQNYLTQYYDKVDNPSEATQIVLNANMDNVDFILKEKPSFTNSITGTVTGEGGNGIAHVRVIAFLIDPAPDNYRQYSSRESDNTDESGIFKIKNLIAGKYILMFYIKDTRNIPGYFKSNSNALGRSWREATKFEIGETTNKSGIVLKVQSLPIQESGRGKISGVAIDAKTQSIIPGAVVYVQDQYLNIKYFTTTDDAGYYEIRGMKGGNYKITADKIGFNPCNDAVELVDDSSAVDEQLKLYPIVYDVSDDYNLHNIVIYPNPADFELKISTTGMNSNFNFKVYNSLGILILSDSYYANGTNSTYMLDVSTLTNGVYYLEVGNGINSKIYPFVIAR